jgi:hypothetical protein
MVQSAEREFGAAGRSVACGPGCRAFRRQLVPVAPTEAIVLLRGIAQLDTKSTRAWRGPIRIIRQTAAVAQHRNQAAELRRRNEPESRRALGLLYFASDIACQFLADGFRSIHDQRQLACHEYVVASTSSGWSHPESGTVENVEMLRPLSQICRCFAGDYPPQHSGWAPLILARYDVVVDTDMN